MAKDNHPGRAGGEHASSKNSKDAGDRARGGGGGGSDNRGNNPGNPNARGYLDYDDQTTTMPNGARVPVGKMRTDYMDYTNPTFADKLGGFLSGFGGFAEKNPFKDPQYGGLDQSGNPTAGQGARWGFDPLGAAVSVGSMFTPVPIGLGYRGLKYGYEALTDKAWPTVDMGPSVFGGAGQAASNGGGLLGGGGNPSDPNGNRGAGDGLLHPTTQPGVTPQAPVMPAAQPAVQQAQERKKRMFGLNTNSVAGPTPYSFVGAKWL